MGYEVFTYIAVSKCTDERKQELKKWISENNCDLEFPIMEWRKWSNMEKDSIKLTQKFSDLTFAFLYIGEDYDDNSCFTAHNGTCTGHQKIMQRSCLISDELEKVYKKINYELYDPYSNFLTIDALPSTNDKTPDELYDIIHTHLNNKFMNLRHQLVMKKINTLNMDDISSYF